ncbi:hypothetical protein Ancab_037642 [Ancistrocladus abbreviatus]
MAEEEMIMQVEAMQAVCGDDCEILNIHPPHLRIHIKSRTSEVSSQQAIDEERLKHLSASLHEKAYELTSSLMLIALCEEAVD